MTSLWLLACPSLDCRVCLCHPPPRLSNKKMRGCRHAVDCQEMFWNMLLTRRAVHTKQQAGRGEGRVGREEASPAPAPRSMLEPSLRLPSVMRGDPKLSVLLVSPLCACSAAGGGSRGRDAISSLGTCISGTQLEDVGWLYCWANSGLENLHMGAKSMPCGIQSPCCQ